jgi:hypothetical protein
MQALQPDRPQTQEDKQFIITSLPLVPARDVSVVARALLEAATIFTML